VRVVARAESGVLLDVIERARSGRYAELLVVGDPGVGKSTLLASSRNGSGPGRSDGLSDQCVISLSAIESEREVPMAAFTSLVRPLLERSAGVDESSRALLSGALKTARLRHPAATGMALVDALAAIATQQLLVLEIDDAHWLDDHSARLIRFATRRLPACSLAIIATRRPTASCIFDDAPTLTLGGLGRAQTREMFPDLPVAVADACHALCDGHPLALVNLVESLSHEQRVGQLPLPDVAPVPARLADWSAGRVDGLDERSFDALTITAIAGNVTMQVLTAALSTTGLGLADLDPAVERGVLVRDSNRFHFEHPLIRTAVIDRASPTSRRRAHEAVAASLPPGEQARIAWHLAESALDDTGPAIAALVAAARAAESVGSHLDSAAAWARAADLNDSTGASHRTNAGRALWDAGRPDLAEPILKSAVDGSTGAIRAAAAELLGQVRTYVAPIIETVRFLEAEARLAESDHPDLSVALYVSAARAASLAASPLGREMADEAERVAVTASEYSRVAARTVSTHVKLIAGDGSCLSDRLAELDALEAVVRLGADRSMLELGQLLGFDLMVRERWADARDLLVHVATASRRGSFSGMESFATAMASEVAWRTSDWARARADAVVDASFYEPHESLRGSYGDATLARVLAAQGEFGAAAVAAQSAVDRGDRLGLASLSAWGRHAQGLIALSSGDAERALVPLRWIWRLERSGAASDPGVLWWHGDLLDALVAGGALPAVERFVDQLAVMAERTDRVWAHAIVCRGRGVLHNQIGALEESASMLDAIGASFEAARSRYAATTLNDPAGIPLLHEALEAFERLGAEPWAARVRRHLGIERRDSSPVGLLPLTVAETRVALVVAGGASNQEAAQQLNLNRRTVEAHLASVYRKLGIRNRTELAVRVAASSPPRRPDGS
jgi:DNA-binding CsgD family transcriptional regulator